MSIERDVFKRKAINFNSLISYGFKKHLHTYTYSKILLNGFRVDIYINEKEEVNGKIYDLDINEEYINFRIESFNGEFVNKVRQEYLNLLKDIASNCTEEKYFLTNQANRISNSIIDIYNVSPEFLWDKYPSDGIFRHSKNKKWFAIIMSIAANKLDISRSGEIEIIDLKLMPDEIGDLIKKDGFYPGYHMNKKHWITITLDDTISDQEVLKYIDKSYQYTE